MSNYQIIKSLSKGTYGETLIVKINNKEYCIKKFFNNNMDDFIREIYHFSQSYTLINIHKILNNSIIIDLYNHDMTYLIRHPNLNTLAYDIFYQLINQLYILHSYGFLHSDIKLNNLLCNTNSYVICDFGLTEFYGIPKVKKKYYSTKYYTALDNRQSVNIDIYSLGCAFFYLFTRFKTKFITNIDSNTIYNNLDLLAEILDKKLIYILEKMICGSESRYSAKNLLISFFDKPNTVNLHNYISLIKSRIMSYTNNNILPNKNTLIFSNLNIKKNLYMEYTYEDIIDKPKYELEYLDDMFIFNIDNLYRPVSNYKLNTNYTKYLNIFINNYFISGIHLETLFYGINLFNYLYSNLSLVEYNYVDVVETVLDFSKKLLEFSTDKNPKTIEYVENYLHKNLNRLKFKTNIFYIYYYIFSIIRELPSIYYVYLKDLESISLSLLFIYMIDISTYIKTSNIHSISLVIILSSIDFIKFGYLSDKDLFYHCIKTNFNKLSVENINNVVENERFRLYLVSLL